MNKAILIGRLTRDPDVRYSQSDNPLTITRFTVACDRRFANKNGERDTDFISCVAFGATADFIGKYFTKGMRIGVTGRIQVSSFDDANGQRRWTTEVVVEEAEFVESKSTSDAYRANQSQTTQAQQPTAHPTDFSYVEEAVVDDDGLPF